MWPGGLYPVTDLGYDVGDVGLFDDGEVVFRRDGCTADCVPVLFPVEFCGLGGAVAVQDSGEVGLRCCCGLQQGLADADALGMGIAELGPCCGFEGVHDAVCVFPAGNGRGVDLGKEGEEFALRD